MALPPSVQSGQSNSPRYSQPTQFVQQGYNAPGFQTGNIIGTQNPTAAIDASIVRNATFESLSFPTDQAKYHTYIIEGEIAFNSRTITSIRQYKLPLPMQLTRQHEVNYNTDFNYLSLLPRSVQEIAGGAGRAGQGFGLAINNFKSVTINVPDFQTFQMTWKLSPKDFPESGIIQRIITGIQHGMHPRVTLSTPTTVLGQNLPAFASNVPLIFGFPNVFSVGLIPNSQYLFKMKPAVISSIEVDYNGGQPVPSFYKTQSQNSADSPPESVFLKMNFIELEYWLNTDFPQTGLPSTEPFISNAFTYISPDERAANQRAEARDEEDRLGAPPGPARPLIIDGESGPPIRFGRRGPR